MIEEMIQLPDKIYFRPDEVAKYFGIHIRTVYRLCEQGDLQYIRIRRNIRIKRSSILKFDKAENPLKRFRITKMDAK